MYATSANQRKNKPSPKPVRKISSAGNRNKLSETGKQHSLPEGKIDLLDAPNRPVIKAKSFDEQNNATPRQEIANQLFGRMPRSSSLTKATSVSVSVSQTSLKEPSSKDPLMDTNNSIQFRRGTSPQDQLKTSKPMKAKPKVQVTTPGGGRPKSSRPKTSKPGPCKCKACTQQREVESTPARRPKSIHSNSKEFETPNDNCVDLGYLPKKKLSSPSPHRKLPSIEASRGSQSESPKVNRKSLSDSNSRSGLTRKGSLTKKKKGKAVQRPSVEDLTRETPITPRENPSKQDIFGREPKELKSESELVDLEPLGELKDDDFDSDGNSDFPANEEVTVTPSPRGDLNNLHPFNNASVDAFALERSGTESTCMESIFFQEMQEQHSASKTAATGLFGFLDFAKEMGGEASDSDNELLNLTSSNRERVIESRLGSRMDNTSGQVMQWKRGPMLGRGAFGTVWCGLTITGELIAVKQSEIVAVDLEKAQREYEKIQSEVEVLKSLNHPHIVGYLGTCLDGRVVSIFMQYIPGGSIAGILKKFGSLAEPVFARYTKQIVNGVCYLHSKQVIHRDIKGTNVMLMHNGIIKLIDFGCAKKIMHLNKNNEDILLSMKGTPYWMSPELINESVHDGAKSDVWSIGCTVFEMATGKPPYSHMNKYAALFAISTGNFTPQLSDKFSSESRDFLAKCLTRDPNRRPDAQQLLLHPLITRYVDAAETIHDSKGVLRNSAGKRKVIA